MTTTLVLVALTEDKPPRGTQVVLGLVRLLLTRVLDPATQTQRIRFEPYDDAHRPVVSANQWLSTSARDQAKVTELNRYIARVLKQAPLHVVVHHIDADEPWSGGPSTKLQRWSAVVQKAVDALAGHPAVDRLVPLVPHPELEGWLYLNWTGLSELASKHGKTPPAPPPGGWDACSGVKDEHPWPKDEHNEALLKGFPVTAAIERSPSLAAAVTRLRAVPGLAEALAATYAS